MRASASLAVIACLVMNAPLAGPALAQQTAKPGAPVVQQPKPTGPSVRQPTAPVTTARLCGAGVKDCDGDNEDGIPFGGLDCDDNDNTRSPRKTEIADFNGKDEDCDATIFGFRDFDKDGEIDAKVYNTGSDGKRYGGTDCDDAANYIRTLAQELPNGLDDNCDGAVDNLRGAWFNPK